MTDFGRRLADMFKSTYDTDKSDIVDDSESTADHALKHGSGGSDEVNATGLIGRVNYVDRGDPSSFDISRPGLVTDGTEHIIDLSAIVPVGTIAVDFYFEMSDSAIGSFFLFKKNGNSNNFNRLAIQTQVANIVISMNGVIFLDSNLYIAYLATNTAFVTYSGVITGWYI